MHLLKQDEHKHRDTLCPGSVACSRHVSDGCWHGSCDVTWGEGCRKLWGARTVIKFTCRPLRYRQNEISRFMPLSGGSGKPNLQNFEGISKSGNQSPELLGSGTLGHPGKAVRDTTFTDRAKQTSEPTAEQSFGLNPLSTLASGKLRPGSAQGSCSQHCGPHHRAVPAHSYRRHLDVSGLSHALTSLANSTSQVPSE